MRKRPLRRSRCAGRGITSPPLVTSAVSAARSAAASAACGATATHVRTPALTAPASSAAATPIARDALNKRDRSRHHIATMSRSDLPDPLVLRGRAAYERGDLAGAEAAAAQRLRAAADDVDALELRFLVQKRRGQAREAVQTLDAVIGINPRLEWAYNELAQIFMALGRLADAGQIARTALRVNPRSAAGNNLLGLVLSEMNDLPPGEWHFRRALELAGPHAPYLMNLALNLLKQGRTDEADHFFAEAHRLAPQDAKTLAHWATLYEGCGDLKRAQELLERAAAISSPDQVSLLRANLLSRMGGHNEALAILDAAGTLAGDAQLQRGRL